MTVMVLRMYYDINALSNFVADGQKVVGFDPFARLADWLEAEAKIVNDRRPECRSWRGQDAKCDMVSGCRCSADGCAMSMTSRWRRAGSMFRDLTLRAEKIGYDLTLIAELNLNDIKGVGGSFADAWSNNCGPGCGDGAAGVDGCGAAYVSYPALLAKAGGFD